MCVCVRVFSGSPGRLCAGCSDISGVCTGAQNQPLYRCVCAYVRVCARVAPVCLPPQHGLVKLDVRVRALCMCVFA